MACTVERLRQAARNVPVVLLLGRLKNSAWVGSIPPLLFALSRATSAERARASSSSFFRRCMQNGPADQADLADFIARGNKPDLVALLRHAGERLPSGSDTAADHRVVLLHYLRRAPGHLILALESQAGALSEANQAGASSSSKSELSLPPASCAWSYAVAALAAMTADTRPVPGLGAQTTR